MTQEPACEQNRSQVLGTGRPKLANSSGGHGRPNLQWKQQCNWPTNVIMCLVIEIRHNIFIQR